MAPRAIFDSCCARGSLYPAVSKALSQRGCFSREFWISTSAINNIKIREIFGHFVQFSRVIHELNQFLEPWKIVLILIQHPVPVPKVVKSDKILIKVVKAWKTRSNKKWSVYQKPTDHFEMGFFNFSHHQGLTVLAVIITGLLILDVHLRNQFWKLDYEI